MRLRRCRRTEAGVQDAALVLVALPEIEPAYRAVRYARALNASVPIHARAHQPSGRDRLVEAGATEVILPEMEAASTLIRHGLRALDLPRDRVLAYVERFRDAMDAAPRGSTVSGTVLPELQNITIAAGGLADQSLQEARIRERFGVTVVVVTRVTGEVVLHPSADTVLRPGDRALVFGLPEQIARLARELTTVQ